MDIDKSVADDGKKIYAELEQTIKTSHPGQSIAIEPISGRYFIAPSMGVALSQGKAIFPNRQFYTAGIGKPMHIPLR